MKKLEILVLGLVLLADRVTKLLAASLLKPIREAPIIKGFFRLYYTQNTGAAFSMLDGHWWLLVLLPAAACVFMCYLLFAKVIKNKPARMGILLVMAGALGNLYDRIVYGYVVDMFDFTFVNFAVFNFADISITAGAILLGVYVLFIAPKEEKAK